MLFARLAKEPYQFAPQVVAEMTIPQAINCFKETDPEKIKKQTKREADDAELFKDKETISFDTVEEMQLWRAKKQKEKQDAGL